MSSGRRALLIGAGGLGGPAALGLAAGGVAHLTLLDDDRVDRTNLSRQMFYDESSIGRLKVEVAAEALRARFPAISVDARPVRFVRDDATRALVGAHDVVLDGSDNFATRFAANDLCVEAGVALVHGAALQWRGQVLTVLPGRTACLRCVFEGEPPPGASPSCAEAGVIAPLVGIIGGWMAEEALSVLAGRAPATSGALRVFEALIDRERYAPVGRDPLCLCARFHPAHPVTPFSPSTTTPLPWSNRAVSLPEPAARIDVCGLRCPMTWVRTKLALEGLAAGAVLEVSLGPGEMLINLPRNAAEDGHEVLDLAPIGDGRHRMLVRKRGHR